MKKILISTSSFGKVNPKPLQMLKDAGFEVKLNPHGKTLSKEQSLALLSGIDGLIAGTEPIDNETFNQHPQLRYICRLGTGMDSVDLEAAKNLNIPVENTPIAHVDGVAELCLGGILDLHRNISFAHASMKQNIWKKPMGSLLKGKKIGLIGLGKVAKRLVELLKPFETEIIATDLFWDEEFANSNGIRKASKGEILKNADVVSLHVPFTPSNKHMIGKSEFALLKSDAMIVNTSRGGLIDENELISFLKENEQAKAYIDTFEAEPYSGELIEQDRVLLTPHIGSYAKEVRINMEMECAKKIIAFFN